MDSSLRMRRCLHSLHLSVSSRSLSVSCRSLVMGDGSLFVSCRSLVMGGGSCSEGMASCSVDTTALSETFELSFELPGELMRRSPTRGSDDEEFCSLRPSESVAVQGDGGADQLFRYFSLLYFWSSCRFSCSSLSSTLSSGSASRLLRNGSRSSSFGDTPESSKEDDESGTRFAFAFL